MARKSKRHSAPEETEKTNTCPACKTNYPEREPEELFTCVECGKQGLDCCVPGNNAVCVDCEA